MVKRQTFLLSRDVPTRGSLTNLCSLLCVHIIKKCWGLQPFPDDVDWFRDSLFEEIRKIDKDTTNAAQPGVSLVGKQVRF